MEQWRRGRCGVHHCGVASPGTIGPTACAIKTGAPRLSAVKTGIRHPLSQCPSLRVSDICSPSKLACIPLHRAAWSILDCARRTVAPIHPFQRGGWPSLHCARLSHPPTLGAPRRALDPCDHRFIVGVLGEQRLASPLAFPFQACSFSLQGWGLNDLLLRASNEGSPRPRVARAQKIISLHPFFPLRCSTAGE